MPVAAANAIEPEELPPAVVAELDACRAAVRSLSLHDARERVETALRMAPTSFTVNAIHGEVLYRLGLYKEASSALFTALLEPPSSWRDYQLVNHLYQESRARERGSFVRTTDCAPPAPVEKAIRWVAGRLSFLSRFRRLDVPV